MFVLSSNPASSSMLRKTLRIPSWFSECALAHQGYTSHTTEGTDGMQPWHFPSVIERCPKSLWERKIDFPCGPPLGVHWPVGLWPWVILPDLPAIMDLIRNTSLGAFQASTETVGKNNRRQGFSTTFSNKFPSLIVKEVSGNNLSWKQNGCHWHEEFVRVQELLF